MVSPRAAPLVAASRIAPSWRASVFIDAAGYTRPVVRRDCGGVRIERADAQRIIEHEPGALQHILLTQRVAAKARVGYDIETPVCCPFDAEPRR